MLDFARDIIGTQPILTAFLAIGLGYLVGQINLGGFSLGVGAVLFVGLALGAFAPKAQITGPIGLIGLIMFLYGVGILYGRQFFEGMIGAAGRKYNLLAFVAVVAGPFRRARAWPRLRHQSRPHAGLFAGSMTSTATLQAALDTMRNSEPSIGYSVAYPFGVIGPILCIYFMTRAVKPKFPPKEPQLHMAEITLGADCSGRTLDALRQKIPGGVQVDDGAQRQPEFSARRLISLLDAGDALLVIAERQSDISDAAAQLGKLEPGRVVKDRSALDYIRVFVGKANLVGIPLGKLPLPAGFPVQILHVRRYDVDIVPAPDLASGIRRPRRRADAARAEGGRTKIFRRYGQIRCRIQLRVIGRRYGARRPAWANSDPNSRRRYGDARHRRRTADRCPHRRQAAATGPLLWVMPLPANIVLRNFGLALFLATVGVNAGQPFLKTVSQTGLTLLLIGVAVLLITVLIVLLVGYYLLKIPYDDLVGVASGATGNPAILVYSTRMAPTERPDIGYAMIFPSMTIVKVVAVQIVGLLLGTGVT